MRPLFFDVDGVLVRGYHHNPAYRNWWHTDLKRDLGIDPDELAEKFFKVKFGDVVIGKRPLKEALAETLPQLGFTGDPQTFINYWLTRDSNVDRALIWMLDKLKDRGVPLYIATNQDHMRADYLWETLRFRDYFDGIFYSAKLGVSKTDPAFFAKVEKEIDLKGKQPLLFDDTPDVIASARKAGWEGVQYETLEDFSGHPAIAELLAQNVTR